MQKKVKELPNKKSVGWDDISYFMVKILGDYLAKPLMRIANGSTILKHQFHIFIY